MSSESFRNRLWPGSKTSQGIEPDLFAQFQLLEDVLTAAGARKAASDASVGRVLICTPDKDLAQCVQGARVVQLNRRTKAVLDELAVFAKYGVLPASVPDYLALVVDNADGYPGLPGWGASRQARIPGNTSAALRDLRPPSAPSVRYLGNRRSQPRGKFLNSIEHESRQPLIVIS